MNFPIVNQGKQDLELEKHVLGLLSKRMEKCKFKVEDIAYVKSLSLFPVKDASNIDEETLERLRRLCEVWEVQFKAPKITSHRALIGPVIVFVKRLLYPLLQVFLKEPFAQQRKFNAEALSLLADLAGRTGSPGAPHKLK